MKRELAFVLQTQRELTTGLGRTRASKVQILRGDLNNRAPEGRSRKRFKENDSECNGRTAIDQNQGKKVTGSQCNVVDVYRRTRRCKERVIADKTKCNLDEASSKEELRHGIEKPFSCEEGSMVVPLAIAESNNVMIGRNNDEIVINDVSNEVNNSVLVESPRRFTRSALNFEACNGEKGRVLSADPNESSVVCVSGTETKILEMKMSKKMALRRKPRTINELFSTGLLEGCSVFYNGGDKESVLRGMINGVGILCFCSLCKGSEVIGPRAFEYHASKLCKRAARYICLENGKSLLEVLKACRKSPLDMLEETIQSVISLLLEKEYISCNGCKGSFLATSAEKVELLCSSCVGLKNSEASITETSDTNARSLKQDLSPKISATSSVHILSQKNQGKIEQNSLSSPSVSKSTASASVHILSETNSQGMITKKVLKPVYARKSNRTASVWIPLQKSKITKKSSKPILSPSFSQNAALPFSPQEKSKWKITKKSSEPISSPSSSHDAALQLPPQEESKLKITKKSSEPILSPSSQNAAFHLPPQEESKLKITKKSSEPILSPSSSQNAALHLPPQEESKLKITKKDLGFHKLVFEDNGLPDGTELAYYSRGKKLLDGYKMGLGIFCRCCNSEVSASQFEAHAGWASRRKPYQYIYTSNGVSLHEFAISLLKSRSDSAKDNDDLCIICGDGGNLLLCDVCPRAFHIECASLTSIPRGQWYCQYCQNMFQKQRFLEYNANALAAGRVYGVDPIEQITKRCIRIVKNSEAAEVIACVLCRSCNFRKSGFGPLTVIVCDQCEKEYHVGCLKKHKMVDLQELPKGKWFCCMDCERIFSALQNLVVRGEEKIPDSHLDVIKKKYKEKVPFTPIDLDVRWRVLSGKIASPDTRMLLSKAVAIFHDCFDPIIDSATGRDFIPSMVYGRNIRGQDFAGMYCAVLTLNSCVVSAGIFRVFGQEIAELPLVATSNNNQGKGYFQILFTCIEKLLEFLNVKWLVLPAAAEAESIWTHKFGFEKIPVEQLSCFRKTCWQILTFTGTSMLQKMVPSG